MRNFFKWVLVILIFEIGYCFTYLFLKTENKPLGILFMFGMVAFHHIPALEYWKRYIDKVFDNKEKTEE